MLVHHVLFWLNNPESAEDKSKFLTGLQTLKEIKSISQIFIGTVASPDRPVIDRSYTFSLMLIFENIEAHDAYQVDPIHKKFLEGHNTMWSKVQIYDAQSV